MERGEEARGGQERAMQGTRLADESLLGRSIITNAKQESERAGGHRVWTTAGPVCLAASVLPRLPRCLQAYCRAA